MLRYATTSGSVLASAEYDYHYDAAGRLDKSLSTIAGLSKEIQQTHTRDPLGRRTGLAVDLVTGFDSADWSVDTTVAEHTNAYTYDHLNQLTRVTQSGGTSGNAGVAAKRVDLEYDNAGRLGATIDFRHGDWFAPVAGEHFDLIVSNPPYVAEDDPHLALNGLPFEPRIALTDGDTGGDGLACIRHIVAAAPAHLQTGGWLLFEHGYDQAAASRNLLPTAGFKTAFTHPDLAGIDRVSGGQL